VTRPWPRQGGGLWTSLREGGGGAYIYIYKSESEREREVKEEEWWTCP
jgi:hypothetical protein